MQGVNLMTSRHEKHKSFPVSFIFILIPPKNPPLAREKGINHLRMELVSLILLVAQLSCVELYTRSHGGSHGYALQVLALNCCGLSLADSVDQSLEVVL